MANGRINKDEMHKIFLSVMKLGELFGSLHSLKRGDNFGVDCLPGKGTTISINGKPPTEVMPEEELITAMLKIWVGDTRAENAMKTAVL